jgi:hypothetical protein
MFVYLVFFLFACIGLLDNTNNMIYHRIIFCILLIMYFKSILRVLNLFFWQNTFVVER